MADGSITGVSSGRRRFARKLWPRARGRRAVIAGVVLLGLAALLFAAAWVESSRLMIIDSGTVPSQLGKYPVLARVAEPLKIHSSTGVTLIGRFFPGRSRATVVLSDGYGVDEDEMLPTASALHSAGFTVVTYNERGRDGSGGVGTWGALETTDLRSVIDTVVRHPGVDPNEVGELGFSIGADISILEAAHDPRVKAVVAAGSWPSLSYYMHDDSLGDMLTHPIGAFKGLSLLVLELRTGADLGNVTPVDSIARISPRPLLLIQGTADADVKPQSAVINYAHARAPKTLWMVQGASHDDLVGPGGATSSPRVVHFFERALLSARSSRRAARPGTPL